MNQSTSTEASKSFLASTSATDGLACLLDQAQALVTVLVQDEGYSNLPEAVLGNMLDILQEKLQAMGNSLSYLHSSMGVMQ